MKLKKKNLHCTHLETHFLAIAVRAQGHFEHKFSPRNDLTKETSQRDRLMASKCFPAKSKQKIRNWLLQQFSSTLSFVRFKREDIIFYLAPKKFLSQNQLSFLLFRFFGFALKVDSVDEENFVTF